MQGLEHFVRSQYKSTILKQTQLSSNDRRFITYTFKIDMVNLIFEQPQIANLLVSNYPEVIKCFQKGIKECLKQESILTSQYGSKICLLIQNCNIPCHNIKSTQFITASLSQLNGILIYLKDIQIVSLKQIELYLQSWNEVWQYQCQCMKNKIVRKRQSQSLLDIITIGNTDLKDYTKRAKQIQQCDQCLLRLKFIGTDELIYQQCQQIQVIVDTKRNSNRFEIFNTANLRILLDKFHLQKFKKGEIVDMCCFLKNSVQISKSLCNKVSAQLIYRTYLVCSYPKTSYLDSSSNLFFRKVSQIQLSQKPILSLNSISSMVQNYNGLIQSINLIKYPYLQQNTLTALKLVTLSSIFGLQANNQRLHLMVLTDQVSLIQKTMMLADLAIRKFPTLYDQKTLQVFFNTCKNSILIIVNPNFKECALINKIIKKQLYQNLNFVLWVVLQPQQGLKKRIDFNQFHIVLDLTIQKNTNVCQSVYVMMLDNLLNTFAQEEEEDQFIINTIKKFRQSPFSIDIDEDYHEVGQDYLLRQQQLANDVLEKYFLKSREYKTTKLNSLQNLTKIAKSFSRLRCFIQTKNLHPSTQYLSILDVILSIFLDQQTSRNKFSSSNTLFSTDVSKIMLNQNNCNVSVWDYQVENGYVEECQKFITRDQLVKIVVAKMFTLIYEDQN